MVRQAHQERAFSPNFITIYQIQVSQGLEAGL